MFSIWEFVKESYLLGIILALTKLLALLPVYKTQDMHCPNEYRM